MALHASYGADDELETGDVHGGIGGYWLRFGRGGAFFFTSIFSASNLANKTSPMATVAPTGTFSPNGLSSQIFTAGTPSFSNTKPHAFGT